MLGIEGSFLHHFRKKVEAFIERPNSQKLQCIASGLRSAGTK